MSDALRHIDGRWLAPAIASVFLTVAAVTLRWQLLLGASRASVALLGASVIASQVANIVMPFRLGDAARIGLVSRAFGMPAAEILASVAIERFFDVLLVALTAAALAASGAVPPFVRAGMVSLAFTLGALLAAAVLAARFRGATSRATARLHAIPARVRSWVEAQTGHLFRGASRVSSLGLVTRTLAWSVAVLTGSVLTAWLVFQACGLDVPLLAAIVSVITVQIGGAVVPIPGAIGIAQVLTVEVLRLWGIPEPAALAASLVLYLVARVPKIAILPFMLPLLNPARAAR